jgi:hypothetical protein
LLLLANLGIFPARASAQTAELRGTISDDSGAILPGVTVTIRQTDTGIERSAVTDDRGLFRAPALQPGPYRVTSELMGFKTDARMLRLTVGDVSEVRITLSVGQMSETIQVIGTAAAVDTTKADLSGVVSEKQLADLPVLNRGFVGLAQLLPGGGPSRAGDARFGIQTAFGGTNVRSMYTMQIDGSDLDHPIYGLAVVNVNQDAVQEFRVLRNQYDAEYSRAGTAVVNVLTRSGTNDWHGMGSYYGRDAKLNAQNAFATTKPPFDSTRVSGTFGGPVLENRAHFFGAVERLRQNSVQIIALPAANPFASAWNGVYGNANNETTGDGKVDYQLNPNHAVNVRYLYDNLKQPSDYVLAEQYINKAHDVAGTWNWNISSSKLNTVYAGYLDQDTLRFQSTPDAQVIRPSFTSGRSPNLPQGFPRKRWRLNETFFWAPAPHALKFGTRLAHEILNYDADYYGSGVWEFNTDRPFNATDPATWPFRYTTGSGPQSKLYENNEWGFFAQDDWRVGARLTLNLGLRYDFDSNLRSNDFIAQLVADPAFAGLSNLVKSPRGNDYSHVQPRLGFAWDTLGTGRFVVRGGWGVYAVRNRPWFNIRGQVVSSQFTAEVTNPALLGAYPDRTAVLGGKSVSDYIKTAGGRALYLPGDDLDLPTVQNVTLGFAKTLTANTTIEVDGIHQKQSHLQTGHDANLPARGPLATNPRPYPQFGTVTLIDGTTSSWYDALQTSFKSRYRSATFQVSYTLAKSISDGTNDNANTSTDPWHTFGNDDRGLDENDRRHALSWTSIVQLPYDIQVSAIVSLHTGNPWDITAGQDLNGDGINSDRPAGLVKDAGGWANDTNLAIINAYRASRGRAPIAMDLLTQGGGDQLVDVRLMKAIRLAPQAGSSARQPRWGAQAQLDLFFEGYNLFNHVNYENPSGNMSSASFAVRTVARDPRQLQWGARFRF